MDCYKFACLLVCCVVYSVDLGVSWVGVQFGLLAV